MQKDENCSFDEKKLSEVIRIAARYHKGILYVKTCDYFGINPGDPCFLRVLEENGVCLDFDRSKVEKFVDDEIQELVKLVQDDDNMYARMRIIKLLEPVINKCYRKPEGEYYTRDDYFCAAVLRLYDYIDSYEKKGAPFCYLLRKRLAGLNGELRDESNPFYHGLAQYVGKIRTYISDYEARYDITPTEDMIVEATGICRASVQSCLWVIRANDEAVSLDEPFFVKGSEGRNNRNKYVTLKEFIVDPKTEIEYEDAHKREFIIEEINRLPELERAVVFHKFGFYGEPMSREKVCEELKITRRTYERVWKNARNILILTLKEYKNVV